MMVINGQFPGPLIEANEGDTIVVNIHNTMSIGTSFRKPEHSNRLNTTIHILTFLSFCNRLA